MLDKIFGTKTREKILRYFLLHSDKSFNFREITDELKLPPRTVKTELNNLCKFGILVSFEKKEENDLSVVIKSAETVDEKLRTIEGDEIKVEVETKNIFIEAIKEEKVKKETKKIKEENTVYRANTEFILYEEIKILMFKAQILYEKDFSLKVSEIGTLKLLIFTGFFVNNFDSPVDLFIVGDIDKNKLIEVIVDLERDLGREVNYTLMDEAEFKYRREITDVFICQILDGKKIMSVNNIGII